MGDGLNADGLGFTQSVFGDVGSPNNPTPVTPSQLDAVYDHVVRTDAELVAALEDADANPGVSIRVKAGTYQPFSNGLSAAISPEESTTIHGERIGEDGFAIDGLVADAGTIIDVEGNLLFDGNDVTGLEFKNLLFKNPTTVMSFGDVSNTGLSTSNFEDVAFHSSNNTDSYPIELYNPHRVDMERVVTKFCPLLVDVQQTLSGEVFQSGNSRWDHILASGGTGVTTAPIRLNATDGSLNYITMLRPQVINGGVTTTDGSACIRISRNGGANQQHTILGADLEGDFEYKIHDSGSNNFHEVAGVAGTSTTDVRLDGSDLTLLAQRAVTVYSDNEQNALLGKIQDISGGGATGLVYNKANSQVELYPGNTAFTWQFRDDRVQINSSGTPIRNFGGFVPDVTDLTGTTGSFDGVIQIHDGSGTPSRSICEWRDQSSSWYNYVDGSTFQ